MLLVIICYCDNMVIQKGLVYGLLWVKERSQALFPGHEKLC